MFLLVVGPGIAAAYTGIAASYGDTSYGEDPAIPMFVTVAVLLVCAGFVLLGPLLAIAGVPHPTVTVCFLTGVVGVVEIQLFVTAFLSDVFVIDWPLWSALLALALSCLVGLALLVFSQGREFRPAIAAVAVVAVLRALIDHSTYLEEEREAYDEVWEMVSEHEGRAVLLESQEWSAVRAGSSRGEYLSLDYETADGDWIEVTTWADFAADAPGDPDPADPILHECDFDRLTCEETEEAGLTVVTVQDENDPEGDLVRTEWSPGVYVELEAWDGAVAEDLRALLAELRTVEEDDVTALAEEITGGPRR